MPDVVLTTSATNYDKSLTLLVKRTLAEEFRPNLPWVRECIPASFVAGTNNTMRFMRVEDMDVVAGAPTPGTAPWLNEGVTPYSEDLDMGYEEFSAAQAGRLLKLTDVAKERWANGDLTAIATEKISRNAAATADKRVAEVVGAGTNILVQGGGTGASDVGSGDVVTGITLRRAAATLKLDMVPTFGDGKFHAILSAGVVFDIEGDTAVGGWLDAQKYGGTTALFTGEIGQYAGIRFMESNSSIVKAGAGAGTIDVYVTTVFGPGAFVFGDWGTIEVFYTAPGGHGDELHQKAAVGWKSNYGAMIVGEGTNSTNFVGPRYLNIYSASGL